MTTHLITPPAALAVSLDDVRMDLREPDVALNGQIMSLIDTVAAAVEHRLQRSLITQGRRVTLDHFPNSIRLDMAPILSVESVAFIDAAGVPQTLDPADYCVDKITEPGYIVPAAGKSWPATFDQINAITVDYTSGYGPASEDVPKAIQGYIRARVVQLFADSGASEGFLCAALDRFMVYG